MFNIVRLIEDYPIMCYNLLTNKYCTFSLVLGWAGSIPAMLPLLFVSLFMGSIITEVVSMKTENPLMKATMKITQAVCNSSMVMKAGTVLS
ncbi:hypothetical protein V7457_21340 [Bacillus toyonensis]|uniref:hypothetical protein n=1 Tax=Bacillus cereus group TaxID=86661 RepID=UPI0011458662|nr:hypothetical protein [Bacillus thuringiensis]